MGERNGTGVSKEDLKVRRCLESKISLLNALCRHGNQEVGFRCLSLGRS